MSGVRGRTDHGTGGPGRPAAGRRSWPRDLAMGLRFAFAGGRESWVRTALTGVGVGIGVALLLLSTAVPSALDQRNDRQAARTELAGHAAAEKAHDTLVVADADTTSRGADVRGRLLEAEGPDAPRPPGLDRVPGNGEMMVSPALRELLASGDAPLLRKQLPYRIVGTIGDPGLIDPHELSYYAGRDDLAGRTEQGNVRRIDAFGQVAGHQTVDPILVLLMVIVFVALLMPVGVFIATAVRFGGERRDRRLAALRLIGADAGMTRRIAAGEALAGALTGLLVGAGLFALARSLARHVVVYRMSVFPSDLNPTPTLAVLVAVAVPLASVGVTLLALRGVVIEPLGVVRTTRPPRRRLWWRLLVPLCGAGLLYPMTRQSSARPTFNNWMVIGGTVLLLIAVTALLPWVVERTVRRLGGGAVSWQLAVRRLQVSSGPSTRMVNGIAVAVAGAIALQMLFADVQGDYTKRTGENTSRAQLTVNLSQDGLLDTADRKISATKGVRDTSALARTTLGERAKSPTAYVPLTVGGCDDLRETAVLTSCHDGDVFVVTNAQYDVSTKKWATPGRMMYADSSFPQAKGKAAPWRLPAMTRVEPRDDPSGNQLGGVLATPSAVPAAVRGTTRGQIFVSVDRSDRDAQDRVRAAVAGLDPLNQTHALVDSRQSSSFASLRTGLFIGATCVLALIGASLLVSQLEQLRERRKLLSALVAFGTRRRTLGLSVFWQLAVPMVLGLVLAAMTGLVLGSILLKMAGQSVSVDWASVGQLAGVGAAVVVVVTALALPPLARALRPDGLHTE